MSGTSNVEDTIKDFWATRPRRPRQGRKIAGVAAALGDRYGIDPVIVRVAFVVATVYGGAGILVYLLGWLFLAEQDDEVSPVEALSGSGRSSASTGFTIALGLAMIPAFWWFFDNDFSGFLSVGLAAGALFLLHQRRGDLGRPGDPHAFGVGSPPADPPVGWDPIQPAEHSRPTAEFAGPPAWDPLGAAPFAWDLPEPSSPEPQWTPQQPRKRSIVTPVTMAVVFLAVGAWVLIGPGGWLTVPHAIGIVLGIMGLGMVAGTFTRGGRGLIGLAVPLAFVGIVMTTFWPQGFTAAGFGEVVAQPSTLAEVQPGYQRNVGSVNLDLTKLPASGTVKTTAKVDVGEVVVTVPQTADVKVTCSVGVGDVNCLDQHASGANESRTKTDNGSDGVGGLVIELDALVSGPGSVEVRRG